MTLAAAQELVFYNLGQEVSGSNAYADNGSEGTQAASNRRRSTNAAGAATTISLDSLAGLPVGDRAPSGDYAGAFAVTAGLGIESKLAEFEAAHDDYRSIMLKSLADRLAEAAAEWLHEQVRKQYWGYATNEALSTEELVRESYRGIRPAPGYPACPDHVAKGGLFTLLDASANAGMDLTESYAMTPAASVAGFYLAHPEAKYFAVSKIDRDQLQDWAKRCEMALPEAERWLAPLL